MKKTFYTIICDTLSFKSELFFQVDLRLGTLQGTVIKELSIRAKGSEQQRTTGSEKKNSSTTAL